MDRGHHQRPSRPDHFLHHIYIQLPESAEKRPPSFAVYWAIFVPDPQRAGRAPDPSCPLAPQWPRWSPPSSAFQNVSADVLAVPGAGATRPSAGPRGWRSWRWRSHRSSPPPPRRPPRPQSGRPFEGLRVLRTAGRPFPLAGLPGIRGRSSGRPVGGVKGLAGDSPRSQFPEASARLSVSLSRRWKRLPL